MSFARERPGAQPPKMFGILRTNTIFSDNIPAAKSKICKFSFENPKHFRGGRVKCFTFLSGRVKPVAELSKFFTLLKTAKWPS